MARRKSRRGKRRGRRMSGNQSFAPSVISGTKRKRRTYRPVRKHKRRSKIGAVDQTMQMGGGVVLGVLTGLIANAIAPEKMKGKILSAGKTLAGAGIAYAGRKTPLAFGFGLGLGIQGATDASKDFGVVKGINEFMSGIGAGASDTMTIEMNGLEGTPENAGKLISGAGEPQQMPSVISGDFMGNTNKSYIPSIVSGAGDNF